MTSPTDVPTDVLGQARRLFGDRLPLAVDYELLLRTEGVLRGLVGPREAPRMWERHLFNCAVVAPLVPTAAQVIDVGSGAGLPGLVLAIARPDLHLCLVEPMLRRETFLVEAVQQLGIAGQVEVRRARAEDLHGTVMADVVTARALAPLDRLVTWCLPLVRPGGLLLALKGERAGSELDAVAPDLAAAGAASWSLEVVGSGQVDPPAQVVRMTRAEIAPTAR